MATFLSRLNGWQRLWFVFTVICFILATIIAVLGQRKASAVEDESILAALNADDITRVQVLVPTDRRQPKVIYDVPPNSDAIANIRARYPQYNDLTDSALTAAVSRTYPLITTIDFPRNMNEDGIRDFINKHDNLDTVRTLAARMIAVKIKNQAAEARAKNSEIRESNLRLILYVYAGWFLIVSGLYLLGYAIAWIYLGFKKS